MKVLSETRKLLDVLALLVENRALWFILSDIFAVRQKGTLAKPEG